MKTFQNPQTMVTNHNGQFNLKPYVVTNVVDEPTAAATVLGYSKWHVVDVGGGTTGISILKDGEVIFTADEATGGTHI